VTEPSQVRSRRGPEILDAGPGRRSRVSLRVTVLLGYVVLLVTFAGVLTKVLVEMREAHLSVAMLSEGYLPLAQALGGASSIPLGPGLERDTSVDELYARRGTDRRFVTIKDGKMKGALDVTTTALRVEVSGDEHQILKAFASEIREIRAEIAGYGVVHDDFVAAMEAGEPATVFVPEMLEAKERIRVRLDNLAGRVDRNIRRVTERTHDAQRDARIAVTSLSAVVFSIGLLLLIVTGYLLRPIRQLILGAERIREGNLDERVVVRSGTEVARLAEAFNAMAAALQEREARLEERTEELESALIELRGHQAALIRSERLATIGQMAAQIAHEVRNPLNALGLNADMLVEDVRSGSVTDAAETVAAIKNEVERLTAVTEAYLSLGRLPPLRLDPYPLGVLVRELVRFQQEELEQQTVTVTLDLPDDLPEVMVDPSQLRQALLNILRNASEALAAGGGGTVRISACAEGDEVRLDLADDGPGMDAENVARIFDPFFSTKETGSGLGLPITHQVIAEHGGRIACTSSLGDGTTFSIWLPRSKEA